jgi:alkyldihydroxyacetonephosphate synthase
MQNEAIWKELKTLLGPQALIQSQEELDAHSYDIWPAAIKWKMQGKQPYAPEVIIRPINAGQISHILKWASSRSVPVTPWGLGSSVTGAPLPMRGGIVLDMSAMNRILVLDETNLLVKAQAGILGIELERRLNEHGYTLNHSPQSLDRSSPGGWVSTRAMGQFSSRYGGIEDLTVAYTIILPTGESVATQFAPRAAVGPDLRHIFMGAEGTLGVISDVTMKIFPLPEKRLFESIAFTNIQAGLNVMRKIMRFGLRPFLVRYYDPDEARHAMQDENFERSVMFLGFEGLEQVAQAEFSAAKTIWESEGGMALGPAPVETWMERRFDFSAIENLLSQNGGLAETIEIAHFWDAILDTYTHLKKSLAPYADEVLGHFSHVYPQGTSLYIILLGQTSNDAEAEARIMKIWETAMQICLDQGAAISHHHGIGIARLPYIRQELQSGFTILERMKAVLDPANIMNPGKLGFS